MTDSSEKLLPVEESLEIPHLPTAEDQHTFEHAMQLQRDRALGAAFAHRCLTAVLWMAPALVLSVSVNGYLGWQVAHPPVKYFAAEGGRVTKIIPTDKPGHSRRDVSAFGADTIRQSFTLDFVHYRDQMTQLGERYSEVGFQDYYKALVASNVLKAVKDQRMNLWVDVGPGVIRGSGTIGDKFAWEYQYPVTLKLDGQQSGSPPQRFIFTLRIQQTDVRVKNAGLEVTQVITTNAN
ncbi:TraM protein [Pseudomonas amygdali pv. mori]|uniref:TraM protein n=1 Tax=Pseudomonas amygdali pv. mori TaxID=34065 RepID=A0A3M5JR28_PSEA0|nr:DotI/IcmL family type IV secretion protein [Pseudomonas amygdali]RMT25574.1 TraM protein [Pseudomonas amygdali pv. mori]